MLFPSPPVPARPPRVVITGAGIVTALGVGWRQNADGFRAGRAAFRVVSLFDVSRQRVKTAAEVDLPATLPPTRLGARATARLDRPAKMLLVAAQEAWRQAGWEPGGQIPLILGTTAGGMALGEDYFRQAVQTPQRHRNQPTRTLYYQSQTQGRMVADALGFSGPVTIVSNACASGANAIGQAWELIRRGRAERVLTGGYDALSQLVFSGFDSLQALSPTVCRPFDAARDGLALGEGAAVVALETLDAARRRGASILAELIGYGAVIDCHHLTQPHPEGDAALASMALACENARVTPADIDYVNAHGTGTPLNDSAEALAIRRWAGDRASSLPVSSTKAGIGHLLGGAGAVEAVVCLMALREQWLPPEPAFERPDPACNFPIVREPRDASVNAVLSNSFGFGGVNATLIFRRWP
ncbi:MAG TPA: beta-ketoacyl-[acyl-carrier-protein] synthase family protein [Candidatus Acidoferrum sp.]|jgi:3-oxoacyl-[acyl-carrier-protein] synthase II|nr:beta-ketoacyl-[acyl-carrier-protein] synthase family protein [Candidatus Acidoferrum sp.]